MKRAITSKRIPIDPTKPMCSRMLRSATETIPGDWEVDMYASEDVHDTGYVVHGSEWTQAPWLNCVPFLSFGAIMSRETEQGGRFFRTRPRPPTLHTAV